MRYSNINSENDFTKISSQIQQRIIALWAFSESAFGGILHVLNIPFRGLFISSAAVLFISLIAIFSKSSRVILKATTIVILIKAIVSPYSPLTSYLAVSLQGFLGYLLFYTKKFYKFSSLVLGILVLLFSGLQKIIILTILFGNTLWESLNLFIERVSIELFRITNTDINYGYLLVGLYLALHLAAGLFIGIYAARLPSKISYYKNVIPSFFENKTAEEISGKSERKKKKWFFRPTGIFILIFSLGVIVLSNFYTEMGYNVSISVVIMIIRSFVITFIWYSLFAPVVKKYFHKFISKKKSNYSSDLEVIISIFPQFRRNINYCWKLSENRKGYRRIHDFLSTSFYYSLLSK